MVPVFAQTPPEPLLNPSQQVVVKLRSTLRWTVKARPARIALTSVFVAASVCAES